MKNSLNQWLYFNTFLAGLGTYFFTSLGVVSGQENKNESETVPARIQIIDRDGQEINPKVIIRKSDPGDAVRIEGKSDNGTGKGIKIRQENGVITIEDENGNQQVINAASVMISSSQKSTVENGVEKTEVVRKAIVVDADGKTYEIDLSGEGGVLEPGMLQPPMVMSKTLAGKFMIGVAAQPAAEALAEQLNLSPETALVVQQVVPGSPAAAAGLLENDVLLFANQKELKTVNDLVDAVQQAGEANESISFTLVRDDREISVEVTPEVRKSDFRMAAPGMMIEINPELKDALDQMGDFNFGWAQAGPGIVFNPQDFDVEAMREQMDKVREQHRQQMERMKDAFQVQNEAMRMRKDAVRLRDEAIENAPSRQQMQELLDEIKRLREEVESLKKEKN